MTCLYSASFPSILNQVWLIELNMFLKEIVITVISQSSFKFQHTKQSQEIIIF